MKKILLPNIQFIPQPNGYTCGSTSLYNLAKSINIKTPSLIDLSNKMGTNPKTGTTDIEMTNGLKILGLPVNRYAKRKNNIPLTVDNVLSLDDAFNALKDCIDRNEAFLLRTLMGMYHWVLVYGYDDNNILYMCSCSGAGTLNKEQLFSVWSPREFDGFRVNVNGEII
jgi:hypothetical protein